MADRRTGRGRSITMADVARRAGVSAMTVSRVLRQPAVVADALRHKVEKAIRDTGYIHNLVASSLASQRSGTIALLLPTIASSIFTESVRGISDVVHARGVQMIMAETSYSPADEEEAIQALLRHRPDGFIIVGVAHTKATRAMLEKSGAPVVEIWDDTRRPIDCLVALSNFDAMRTMTLALAERGFRSLAFVGSRTHDRRADMRAKGYGAALKAAGLHDPVVLQAGDLTSMAAGAAVAAEIAALEPRPDVAIFLNDVLAAGAMLALQRVGWRIPDDLAIAGFGDFDFAAQLNPALTTVNVPKYEFGQRAADLLLGRIDGAVGRGHRVDVGFTIAWRESTARIAR